MKVDTNAQPVTDGQQARADDHQFDVFLSYSRKDEEFGKKLEEALENYRLPKDVKTRQASKNRLRVFRDKNDLVPTDGDYWKTIAGYLKRSAYLIVVCSPNARCSEYVNHEINTFLQSHEAKNIIPVLLSGKPNNESSAAPDELAFPDALCGALTMPLALEFSEYSRAGGKLDRGGRYHDSWYSLLAKIFGAERAEIERVDARRQARRLVAVAAISVAVIAVLSVALVFAIISRQRAVRLEREAVIQRDQARRLLYASDMNLAQRAYESGNVGLGRNLLESYLTTRQSGQEELRGFEWYYLWRLYNGQLATIDKTDDIAFSRDGARFATVTADTLKIWDAASLRETASVKRSQTQNVASDSEATYYYSSIDFSPDGNTVAYDDFERVMLLDIRSGSSRALPTPRKKQGPAETPETEGFTDNSYWDLATGGIPRFSPDGELLAVSYGCGIVAVFNARSLEEIVRLGDGPPNSSCTSLVVFSPDGKVLAYGNGYSVRLWDTVARRDLGEPERDDTLADSVDQVEAFAFSRDGKILAIGDRSKQLVLWNISTRKVLARIKGHDEWVSALAFSPDGKTLLSGGLDQTVRLWDFSSYRGDGRVSVEKIKVFATLKGHTGSISSINCSPTGRIVATVGSDRMVKLWDRGAGRDFDTIEGVDVVFPGPNLITRHTGEGSEASTTFFDLRSGEPRKLWTMNGSMSAILSPDGKTLATDSPGAFDEGSSTVKLWDVASRQELITLRAKTSERSPAFSRDGKLFTAVGPDGKSVIFWDTTERKELTPIRNDAELSDYLLSSNGKVVVTLDKASGKVKSWDVASQRQLASLERKVKRETGAVQREEFEQPIAIALSPDGSFLALSDSEKVELWETRSTQAPVILGKAEMKVSALAFSTDGKLVAAGDRAGVVKVWDAVTRGELSAFKGHKDAVTTLAFSPDSRTLASGGDGDAGDGTVKLYSTTAMRELLTLSHEPSPTSETHALQGREDAVFKIDFSADGRSLITLSGNRVLRIWRGANDTGVATKE